MRSGAIRRFALVAAVFLLAPIWCKASVVAMVSGAPGSELVRLAPADAAPAPAIRRHVAASWWLFAGRPHHGRNLVALAAIALLSLLRRDIWSSLASIRSAASALVRRRYVIVLRAPPLPA